MMKKVIFALMLLPLLALLPACSDDDNDLPEVDFEVVMSGGEQNPDDNKIYIVRGDTLTIESITPISRNGKKATLGLTTFYLNGLPQAQTVTVPFGAKFATADMQPGEYTFQIKTSVYQIDKSAAFALLSYDLIVEPPKENDNARITPGNSVIVPANHQLAAQ